MCLVSSSKVRRAIKCRNKSPSLLLLFLRTRNAPRPKNPSLRSSRPPPPPCILVLQGEKIAACMPGRAGVFCVCENCLHLGSICVSSTMHYFLSVSKSLEFDSFFHSRKKYSAFPRLFFIWPHCFVQLSTFQRFFARVPTYK